MRNRIVGEYRRPGVNKRRDYGNQHDPLHLLFFVPGKNDFSK